jgi:hypothetical protein
MKKLYITIIIGLFLLSGCELDNYDGPDAKFYGTIIDYETRETVQQDIIYGAEIEYIEHGFENPQIQYMIIQTDGTFRNDLMFSGTYTVSLVRGNFVTPPSDTVEIIGDYKLDFEVQPYIRVKDANIMKNGNKVTATFKLQQTVTNKVKKIGLYAHPEPSVGEPINQVAAETTINAVTDENTVYTLEIDLPSNITFLKPGGKYYFRVGALIDVAQAKLNYAPAVRIEI